MNASQLNRYRKRLEEQLDSLSAENREHQQLLEDGNTSNDIAGPDRASELETMEVDSSIAESEGNLAYKIRHALTRIDEGTYGICESCGAEIPEARLEAKPSVSLCILCQEEHEAKA